VKFRHIFSNYSDSEWRVCGEVIKAIFDPDRDVGIDAVLVRITKPERKPKDGSFTAISKKTFESLGS